MYHELKELKEKEHKSFSEVLVELTQPKTKKISDLRTIFGVLKDDKEYAALMKDLKKGWGRWTKKYV